LLPAYFRSFFSEAFNAITVSIQFEIVGYYRHIFNFAISILSISPVVLAENFDISENNTVESISITFIEK